MFRAIMGLLSQNPDGASYELLELWKDGQLRGEELKLQITIPMALFDNNTPPSEITIEVHEDV